MFLDDPVTHRQPEPDAPADRLGREERVKDLVADLGRYPRPIV
jgi:hypothetical protein